MGFLKGQITLEALISFSILLIIISLIFSTVGNIYHLEAEKNRILDSKVELENIALRSNFISTTTPPYVKTPYILPENIGYTGNELTKDIEGKKISAPVLARIVWAFGDRRYVVNRLDGEPI